jgi:alpha-ketoglutarate-dependent taurine dioxygenase
MTRVSARELDVEAIRDQLRCVGYAYLPALAADFDYLNALHQLGPLLPQYDGQLVRDIKPDPSISNEIRSALNMAELTPHTEWYEFPNLPPRYVALWCVHPAEGRGGETTLADGSAILGHFDEDERYRLSSRAYRWRSSALSQQGVEHLAEAPILSEHAGHAVLRFSTLDLVPDDELVARYIRHGREHFERTRIAIKIERGAVLIWDNWRMLHARNGFSDSRRHLRRVLIGVEPRARTSRGARHIS